MNNLASLRRSDTNRVALTTFVVLAVGMGFIGSVVELWFGGAFWHGFLNITILFLTCVIGFICLWMVYRNLSVIAGAWDSRGAWKNKVFTDGAAISYPHAFRIFGVAAALAALKLFWAAGLMVGFWLLIMAGLKTVKLLCAQRIRHFNQ